MHGNSIKCLPVFCYKLSPVESSTSPSGQRSSNGITETDCTRYRKLGTIFRAIGPAGRGAYSRSDGGLGTDARSAESVDCAKQTGHETPRAPSETRRREELDRSRCQ